MEAAAATVSAGPRQYGAAAVLRGHGAGVSCVKFSPSGALLASTGADASVVVWGVGADGDADFRRRAVGHALGVSALCWSPDSRLLFTGSDDTTAKVWDAETGACLRTMDGHSEYIFSVCCSPQSNVVATGSFDTTVCLWDIRSQACVRSLPAHSNPVTATDFNQDGSMLVSSSYDGLIRVWETASGVCLKTLIGEKNPAVSSAKFSPNGRFILAGTLDDKLRLWNYAEGKCAKTFSGLKNDRYCLLPAFVGDHVVSGSEDAGILVWDLQSRKLRQRLVGHLGAVLSVDAHPSLPLLASGEARDGNEPSDVRLWSLASDSTGSTPTTQDTTEPNIVSAPK